MEDENGGWKSFASRRTMKAMDGSILCRLRLCLAVDRLCLAVDRLCQAMMICVCGHITSEKLIFDEKGISLYTPQESNKAVGTFHGFICGQKPLYMAIAQRKEERQAQLQHKHVPGIAGLTGSSAFFLGGYAPLYYGALNDLQIHARPGLLDQPLSMSPGWMVNGLTNSIRPSYQIFWIPNDPQYRQNRGKKNGHMPVPDVPHWQQSAQSAASSKHSSNLQQAWQVKYTPNGCFRGMNKGFVSSAGTSTSGSFSDVSNNLNTMLTAAPPKLHKQILGEHLYPHKSNFAAKVMGMLLEMDNSKLSSLFKSPESLAATMQKAVEVLKPPKNEVTSQDNISLLKLLSILAKLMQ